MRIRICLLNFSSRSRSNCPGSYVGMYLSPESSQPKESEIDERICGTIPDDSSLLGPFVSDGPRMILVFHSDISPPVGTSPFGFAAVISFQTGNHPIPSPFSCEDAFLAVYLSGQDWGSEPPDKRYCGASGALPRILESVGPRMVLVFQSADSRDQGFKAEVRFTTGNGRLQGDSLQAFSLIYPFPPKIFFFQISEFLDNQFL